MKLNLGCGNQKLKGYVNCDKIKEVNPDKVVDLEKKLPFKDNSVAEVVLTHVIEHVTNLIQLMEEIYRICKNKAIIKIRTPYFSSESAFSNITHVRYFTLTSFDLFDKNHIEHFHIPNVNFKTNYKKLKWRKEFKLFEIVFGLHPKITRIYQELFCWWFPAKELEIELEVIK